MWVIKTASKLNNWNYTVYSNHNLISSREAYLAKRKERGSFLIVIIVLH